MSWSIMTFKSCCRSAIAFQHFFFWVSHSADCIYSTPKLTCTTYEVKGSNSLQPFHRVRFPVGLSSVYMYLCSHARHPGKRHQHSDRKGERLLGGPTTKLFADCSPRDHGNCCTDKRIPEDGTEPGHSQPLEEKRRGSHFGMRMRCFPLFCWGQNHLWSNNL